MGGTLIPPGVVFEVCQINWNARSSDDGLRKLGDFEDDDAPGPAPRVVVAGEEPIDMLGPASFRPRGKWSGEPAMRPGNLSAAFVETLGPTSCQVQLRGKWRTE